MEHMYGIDGDMNVQEAGIMWRYRPISHDLCFEEMYDCEQTDGLGRLLAIWDVKESGNRAIKEASVQVYGDGVQLWMGTWLCLRTEV